MDLYPSGLLPAGRPMADMSQGPVAFDVPAGPVMPPAGQDAPLTIDDMEFLERVLRDCHLSDGPQAQPNQPPEQPSEQPQEHQHRQQHLQEQEPSQSHQAPIGTAQVAATAAGPSGGTAPVEAMLPWAEELVGHLQACQSPDEARYRCAELLTAFAGKQQGSAAAASAQQQERMRKLQGANSVLLRGFRSLYQKQQEAEARSRQAEEACTRMAAELARCQEQLHNAERAKGALQYHLQLMHTGPVTAAGGM